MKEKSVLDSFGTLRQASQKGQIISGIHILKHFFAAQDEVQGDEVCGELEHGFNRIVRGLGAPKSRARKGYFATLVGVIELFDSSKITLQMCFDAVDKELQNFSSKGEEGDVYKGQALAYGALIYSGKFLHINHKEMENLVRRILALRNKRSYLTLLVHTLIVDLINKVTAKVFKKSVWNVLNEEIISTVNGKKSLWFFHLLHVSREKFPEIVDEKFLTKTIGSPGVFHKNNYNSLLNVLLEVEFTAYIDSTMYQEMLSNVILNQKALIQLWEKVDQYLLSASSLKTIHSFKLFIWCVTQVEDKNLITCFLAPNFVRLLESPSELENVEKHRLMAIQKFGDVIAENGVLNSETQIDIVRKLLFYPGNFGILHGSGRLFQSLVNGFEEDTVKSVTILFTDVLTDKSQKITEVQSGSDAVKRPWKEGQKKIIFNTIPKLINHPAVSNCVDWKIEQLKIIIDIAFFSKSTSLRLISAAQKCFYNTLDQKFARLTNLRSFLFGLVLYMNEKVCENNYISVEFTNEMRKAWKRMIDDVNSAHNQQQTDDDSDSMKLQSTVFHVMFLLLGLSIFKEPKATVENLKELRVIYKRMHKDLKNKMKDEEESAEEPLHWTEVVVDLFLSLLSNNNHFQRNVISKIFIYLCPHLSAHNIHQILKVLNPNVNNIMAATVNGSADSGEENDSTDNIAKRSGDGDEDVEEDDDDASDSDDKDDSDSDIDYSSDDMDETEADRLRATLRDALGNAVLTDTESIDLDEMDEEEGNRLDESLSQAFKQMSQQKLKTQAAEDKQLSDFRARVIDLLEIWIRTEPELTLLLDVMVTMLMLLENNVKSAADIQLQKRIRSFLKKLTSLKRFSFKTKLDIMHIKKLVDKLVTKDDKTASVYINMSSQIVDCCTFILKASLKDNKLSKKMSPYILDVYHNAVLDFFNKKNSIVPVALFQSAFNLAWEGTIHLAVVIANCGFKPNVRSFHQGQALQLLLSFFKNKRFLTPENCQLYSDQIEKITSKVVKNIHLESDNHYHQLLQLYKAIKILGVPNKIPDEISIESLKQNSKKRKSVDSSELTPKVKQKKQKQKEIEDSEEDGDSEEEKDAVNNTNGDVNAKPNSGKPNKKRSKRANIMRLKKKSKLARIEESSKGIEQDIFVSHLFNNSEFIHGYIQNDGSEKEDSN